MPWRIEFESLHRQPAEFQRKGPGQQVADHEHRGGEPEHRKRHHRAVDPRSLLGRRQHAERDRDHDRDHGAEHHQRQGRLQPLRDHVRHRQPGEDRIAEVAVQDLPQPGPEPDQERLVEPERDADGGDLRRRRLVAGDDRRRIAGGEIEQSEDHEGDHQHDRDRREYPPRGVGEHRFSRRTGGGRRGARRLARPEDGCAFGSSAVRSLYPCVFLLVSPVPAPAIPPCPSHGRHIRGDGSPPAGPGVGRSRGSAPAAHGRRDCAAERGGFLRQLGSHPWAGAGPGQSRHLTRCRVGCNHPSVHDRPLVMIDRRAPGPGGQPSTKRTSSQSLRHAGTDTFSVGRSQPRRSSAASTAA